MAISAPYLAVGDFSLRLFDALGVADVARLSAANVVKVERCCVTLVSAISAAVFELIGVKPAANRCRSLVGLSVDARPVFGISQPNLAPSLRLHRVVRT